MNIKKILNNTFAYKPQNSYNFSLPDNPHLSEKSQQKDNISIPSDSTKVFESLDVNLDFVKTKYNALINSDVVIREFVLNARGKQYKAFLLYIDGMVDSQLLNDFVLEPLMLRNHNNLFNGDQNRVVSEAVTNNITVRKVKKFDLSEYIQSCLIPQNNICNKLYKRDEQVIE